MKAMFVTMLLMCALSFGAYAADCTLGTSVSGNLDKFTVILSTLELKTSGGTWVSLLSGSTIELDVFGSGPGSLSGAFASASVPGNTTYTGFRVDFAGHTVQGWWNNGTNYYFTKNVTVTYAPPVTADPIATPEVSSTPPGTYAPAVISITTGVWTSDFMQPVYVPAGGTLDLVYVSNFDPAEVIVEGSNNSGTCLPAFMGIGGDRAFATFTVATPAKKVEATFRNNIADRSLHVILLFDAAGNFLGAAGARPGDNTVWLINAGSFRSGTADFGTGNFSVGLFDNDGTAPFFYTFSGTFACGASGVPVPNALNAATIKDADTATNATMMGGTLDSQGEVVCYY